MAIFGCYVSTRVYLGGGLTLCLFFIHPFETIQECDFDSSLRWVQLQLKNVVQTCWNHQLGPTSDNSSNLLAAPGCTKKQAMRACRLQVAKPPTKKVTLETAMIFFCSLKFQRWISSPLGRTEMEKWIFFWLKLYTVEIPGEGNIWKYDLPVGMPRLNPSKGWWIDTLVLGFPFGRSW